MAGSKIGEAVVKGAQKVRDTAVKVVNSIRNDMKSLGRAVLTGIKSFCGGFVSLFG